MTQSYGWLPEQASEDALHAERLLFIEERPFHRVTRRLLGEDSLLRNTPRQLPSPPPDTEEVDINLEEQGKEFSRHKFWEDVLTDFAALQSSITRIQLIHSSNEREKERYATEKEKILATAQSVKENTLLLRAQLADAQDLLALRKGYDDLASKILDDKKLKSRDEARQDIKTLEKEIEELHAEGSDLEGLWSVRKDAFEKVVDEGKQLIRVIKGIKDHQDVVDAMEEDEEQAKVGSNVGTPRPDGSDTPHGDTDDTTPLPGNSDVMDEDEQEHQSKLRQIETIHDANGNLDQGSTEQVDQPLTQQPEDNGVPETMDES